MDAVYLDHAATTPPREEVLEAMRPYAREVFGNPSSLHGFGRAAHAALEEARATVAAALGAARPSEVVFVRGGTESDNLAIFGSVGALTADGASPVPLAVSAVEHSAVLEAARRVEAVGDARVTEIGVGADGSLDQQALEDAVSGGPAVASLMWANNETGLLLPVAEVAERLQGGDTVLHSDASQAVGKVPVNVDSVPVSLLTATGHKLGGPRGMGILYVRSGIPLAPIHHGGGQERALRPGTEDVAGAVGLACAIRLAVEEQEETAERMSALRRHLESRITAGLDGVRVNAGAGPRAPHLSSLGIPGISDGQALLMALDLEGVAVSGGSACHSGAGGGSHVIAALYGDDDAMATVRFSFGKETTSDEIDRAVEALCAVVGRMAPRSEGAA